MREIFNGIKWQRYVFVYIVVPLGLTIVGPFGTHADMEFGRRLLYWALLVIGIGLVMQPCILYILRLRKLPLRGAIPRIGLGCALATVPSVGIVLLIDILVRQSGRGVSLPELFQLGLNIWIVGVAISLMEMARVYLTGTRDPIVEAVIPPLLDDQPGSSQTIVESMRTTAPVTALHARFQNDQGPTQDIISLSMQDHYVEVTTTSGVHMILMRMRDAVRELEPLPGLKIHRSHWIAEKHLRDLRKDGHRWFAVLSDGRELPVSRTFVDDTEQVLQVIRAGSQSDA